jgi:hypothetical protein
MARRKKKYYTLREARELLRRACVAAGSQAAFSREHGLDATHLSRTLNEREEPSSAELAALGLVRVWMCEVAE